jgi:hypothetical protein
LFVVLAEGSISQPLTDLATVAYLGFLYEETGIMQFQALNIHGTWPEQVPSQSSLEYLMRRLPGSRLMKAADIHMHPVVVMVADRAQDHCYMCSNFVSVRQSSTIVNLENLNIFGLKWLRASAG